MTIKQWTACEIVDEFQKWNKIPEQFIALADYQDALAQKDAESKRLQNVAVPAMQWTTDKPTAPGWYWSRDMRFPLSGGMQVRYLSYLDMDAVWSATREWAGPIAEPEES